LGLDCLLNISTLICCLLCDNIHLLLSLCDAKKDHLGRKNRRKAVFSLLALNLRTIAYIDGFNLYYSLLRHSGHKWLDVVKLIENILHAQDPKTQLLRVKFFTAPVLANFARHGQKSPEAQSAFWRALETRHQGKFEVIKGRHSSEPVNLPMMIPGAKLDRAKTTRVWTLSEKQTDVNLTLQAYKDAISGSLDQVVLVTNDSDFEPVVKAIRDDTGIRVGLILPLPAATDEHRRPSASLTRHAHWTRKHILDTELAAAQMPAVVPTRKKAIRKPGHW
jgi:uncharacterized LabA/DUF88 family protein